MGNDTSSAGGSLESKTIQIDSTKFRRQRDCQTVRNTSENVEQTNTSPRVTRQRQQADTGSGFLNAPKIMIGETAVCKPWTPAEILDLARKSPNPIALAEKYWLWLSQTCKVYNGLIPDVQMLLEFTYGTHWPLCKDEFVFPDATEDGQWPQVRPMSVWMNNEAKTAITKCAKTQCDFSEVVDCVQGLNEGVPEFLQRFMQVWDNNAGMKREENALFAIHILLQNMKPQISTAYKLSAPDWQRIGWKTTKGKLMDMYRSGIFTTEKSTSRSKQMVQQAPYQSGEQPTHRKYNKKKSNCRRCGRKGHWAKECQSNPINPNQLRLTYEPQQAPQYSQQPNPYSPPPHPPPPNTHTPQPAAHTSQTYYNQA